MDFPGRAEAFPRNIIFPWKISCYRYQWCNVFGGFPAISDSLSQKWKRRTLPWLILTLFVRDALEAIYQNWFGNSFLLLSLISMLTEQLKFAQIFPITNVSDLSFSDWEYQLTKDPRIPTHVYMLFIIMIG